MQAFVVCTFNINVLRSTFNREDLLCRVMALAPVLQSVPMLEYLVKLHVNIDCVSSPHFATMRDMLARAHGALEPKKY